MSGSRSILRLAGLYYLWEAKEIPKVSIVDARQPGPGLRATQKRLKIRSSLWKNDPLLSYLAMFHLFVSANEDSWMGEPWVEDASRCLKSGEYTEQSLAVDFTTQTAAGQQGLGKFPCIFAYETGTKKDGRLGSIEKIRKNGAKIQVLYKLAENYPPIKHDDLLKLRWELGIGELELHRTHWALKDEDASSALESLGYPPIDSRTPFNIHDHTFDIALSFPGEVRPYVESVAQILFSKMGKTRVFYDNAYKGQLARPNLDTALQALYSRARLIVAFLSADYASKKWCHIEFRAIREIINARDDDRVMFVRHDSATVQGVFSADGYIDAETHDPAELAEMILERVQLLSTSASGS